MSILVRHSLLALTLAACTGGCAGPLSGGRDLPTTPRDVQGWASDLEHRLTQAPAEPSLLAELALARLSQGRLAEAERAANQALGQRPCHVTALAVSGKIAIERRQLMHAVRRFDAAERCAMGPLGPRILADRANAHVRLATEQLTTGGLADVMDLLERAEPWAHDAGSAQQEALSVAVGRAAELALKQGARGTAERALRIALDTRSDPERAERQQGQLLVLRGQGDEGERALESWAGRSATRWTEIGQFYRALNEPKLALKAWRKASTFGDADVQVWGSLAEAALAMDRDLEALEAFQSGARLIDSGAKRAEYLLDAAAKVSGRHDGPFEGVATLLMSAADADPGSWSAVRTLASHLARTRRGDEAIRAVLAFVAHGEGRPDAFEGPVNAISALGLSRDAIRLLERRIAKGGHRSNLKLLLVQLLHKRRSDWARRDEVLTAYQAAHLGDLERSLVAARLWLTYRKAPRAKEIGERLQAKYPRRFEVGLLMADVHKALGQPSQARRALSEAVARAGKTSQASLAVGQRYLDLREYGRAVRWLEAALKGAEGDEVKRAAHRGLVDALLGQHPPARKEATRHMRAWLALMPESEKVEGVSYLLQRVAGVTSLDELRVDLLQALVARQPDNAELLESLGKALVDAERWEMAVAVFNRAIANKTAPRQLTLRIARAFTGAYQYRHALDFLSRVQPLATELDVQTLRVLGTELYGMGHRERACRYFELFLERTRDGGHTTELHIFARQALQLEELAYAVNAAEQLMSERTDYRDGMLTLGEVLYRLERDEEGALWFRRYVEATPPAQRARAWLGVGERLVALGRLSEGARVFEEALTERVHRSSSALFEQLVATRRRMGDRDGLIRAAKLWAGQSGGVRAANRGAITAARALEQSGLYDEAARMLSHALRRSGSERQLLDSAAENALEREDVVRAKHLYERLARQRGDDISVWREVGQKFVDAGQGDSVIVLLERAIERSEAPAPLRIELGRRLLELGRVDDADSAFQDAASQALSLVEVATSVEKAYREGRHLSRLERFYAGLVARAPARKELALSLGKVRLELGDVAGAGQAFARFLGASPRGHLVVAQAYESNGDVSLALRHYRRAWEQPAPGGGVLPLVDLARWLAVIGEVEALTWFVNLHVRRARDPGRAAHQASEAFEVVGDVAQALHWLREADGLNPDAKYDLMRGQLLLSQGENAAARHVFRRYMTRQIAQNGVSTTLRRKPKQIMVESVVEVAERWVQARYPEEALRTVREAVDSYGESALLVVTEARYLVQMDRVGEGVRCAREGAELFKAAPAAAVSALVDALVERDRYTELAMLLEAADAAHWSQELGLMHIDALGRLERIDDAGRIAQTMTLNTKAQVSLNVGLQAFRSGMFPLAKAYLRRALRMGVDDPLKATRALDAMSLLSTSRAEGRAASESAGLGTTEDRLGQLLLRAQQRSDRRELNGANQDVLAALRLSPSDLRIFEVALSLAVLSGDAQQLDDVLDALQSRQHAVLDVLKVAVKRLRRALRPRMGLRLQARLIAAQPGVVAHRLHALELALQAGDDVAAKWHTDTVLSLMGGEPHVRLELARTWQHWLRPDAAEGLLAGLEGAGGVVAIERDMLRLEALIGAGDEAGADLLLTEIVRRSHGDLRLPLRAVAMALEHRMPLAAARRWLERAQRQGPVTPRGAALGARIAWRLDDKAAARQHLDTLLAMQHVDSEQWGGLLASSIAAGDDVGLTRLAEHLPKRASWSTPEIAVAGLAASALEDEAPRMSEARKREMALVVQRLIARAARRAPTGSASLGSAIAITLEVQGDVEGALAAYEAPLRADASSPVHANNLAYGFARFDRQLNRALELVVSAQRRVAEPVASYMDTEAWVRYRLGDYEAAHDLMAATVHGLQQSETSPPEGQVEMLYHYAVVLEAVGALPEARAVWRDCARRAPTSLYGARCLAGFRAAHGDQTSTGRSLAP
ncbi:MAG: tetratricopeptide repeat protein [Myxococcota bacterium]